MDVRVLSAIGFILIWSTFVHGDSEASSKIVGGVNANETLWKWQIQLQYNKQFICGGTLLNRDTVLTAAHCTYAEPYLRPRRYRVVVGDYNKDKNEKKERGQKRIRVKKIYVHPYYRSSQYRYDVSILKLSKPVTFNEYIGAVPELAGEHISQYFNDNCYTTGWGKTSTADESSILQELQVSLIENSRCKKSYPGLITRDMVCTDTEPDGTCNGDSGGPLVCKHDEKWVHVGTTSWGNQDCTIGPAVYARTSFFRDWISDFL